MICDIVRYIGKCHPSHELIVVDEGRPVIIQCIKCNIIGNDWIFGRLEWRCYGKGED